MRLEIRVIPSALLHFYNSLSKTIVIPQFRNTIQDHYFNSLLPAMWFYFIGSETVIYLLLYTFSVVSLLPPKYSAGSSPSLLFHLHLFAPAGNSSGWYCSILAMTDISFCQMCCTSIFLGSGKNPVKIKRFGASGPDKTMEGGGEGLT